MRRILFTILAALGINIGAKSQIEKLDSGLKNTLKITADRFENKNHAFLINLAKDNTVIMQVIHGALIEQTATAENSFNYSINLTFDNEMEKLAKFRTLEVVEDFEYYEFDGIPCFVMNLGNDQEKTQKVLLEILNKVYGFENSDIFEFEIYDQGPLRR
ncbi:hypothetical protein [Dokdonia donghaensis]|uniref:Uncharacterized protein n=1 Tax=Dokdonia donghaensis DSW-1 TaxID=1300343 RepID=A0A0A2H055_9FLAO|nr:hypothetical protein [Dokdonia donghaensis]ANH61450.1 hypothetical protein I597_2553 [Dokdonia donghaensis DSW-1]KGO06065.1 hypothetical protein NV36_03900 [Dokdonia donghaensis DSW-1]